MAPNLLEQVFIRCVCACVFLMGIIVFKVGRRYPSYTVIVSITVSLIVYSFGNFLELFFLACV